MDFIRHAHSGLRWVALLLLLVAIVNALIGKSKGQYEKKDKMLNLFTMISLHVQLLLGLVLYFVSSKVNFIDGWMKMKVYRFFGLEHFLLMIIAITVITIGRRKAENHESITLKHATIVKWFTIGLVLILAGIPWPFRGFGTGWF